MHRLLNEQIGLAMLITEALGAKPGNSKEKSV